MKEIRKLNRDDFKIGNKYGLASRYTYGLLSTVRLINITDSAITAQELPSCNAFRVDLKEDFIFHDLKEALIAHLYMRHDYIIRRLQEISAPEPHMMGFRFDGLYSYYIGLIPN